MQGFKCQAATERLFVQLHSNRPQPQRSHILACSLPDEATSTGSEDDEEPAFEGSVIFLGISMHSFLY